MSNTEIQGRPVSPFETWTYEVGMSVFEGLAQDSSMPTLSESQRDSLVRQIQRAILDYWPPPQAAFGEHQFTPDTALNINRCVICGVGSHEHAGTSAPPPAARKETET